MLPLVGLYVQLNNFDFMPELRWHYGYFTVLGVIGSGCLALFANFKRLKWL